MELVPPKESGTSQKRHPVWLNTKQMVSLWESLLECTQEAINAPTKAEVSRFSFQGSYKAQNLQTFERNWMFSDPNTLEFDV